METRRATIELNYKGTNITKEISSDLKSFSYTDNASGAADDVAIELKDDLGKWISSWAPTKGDIVRPKIITRNWRFDGDTQSLDCGTFLVDDISYTGRPRSLTIGAISSPSNIDFMTTNKSRTWENASVKEIAQTIAKKAGLSVFFDSKTNPVIDFLEQSEEPDVSFLFELCQKNGLAIKLYNNRIAIFNEAEYEAKGPVATITEDGRTINGVKTLAMKNPWSAKTSFTDTGYDGCKVQYVDPDNGELRSYTFKIAGRAGKKIYIVNEECDSLARAQRLAKSELRRLNKNEFNLSISVAGNLELFAAQTVRIADLGIFAGKYYIDKVSRSVGGGFDTSLDLHRCLEGY
jgi:phage protein D